MWTIMFINYIWTWGDTHTHHLSNQWEGMEGEQMSHTRTIVEISNMWWELGSGWNSVISSQTEMLEAHSCFHLWKVGVHIGQQAKMSTSGHHFFKLQETGRLLSRVKPRATTPAEHGIFTVINQARCNPQAELSRPENIWGRDLEWE